jgi:hypothetical protein
MRWTIFSVPMSWAAFLTLIENDEGDLSVFSLLLREQNCKSLFHIFKVEQINLTNNLSTHLEKFYGRDFDLDYANTCLY